MTKRKAKLTLRYLRNGRIAIYCRGRKLADVMDMASVRAFAEGFNA
jgi:hypothetical protein